MYFAVREIKISCDGGSDDDDDDDNDVGNNQRKDKNDIRCRSYSW